MKYVLDNDLHIHSKISLCSNIPEQTPERILKYAEENDLKTVCLTDHFWDETVPGSVGFDFYEKQNFSHISAALPLPKSDGIRFLFGCETELDKNLQLGISKEKLQEMAFIVIPTTHFHMVGFTVSEEEVKTAADRAKTWVKRFESVLSMDLPFHKIGIAHLTCHLIAPTDELFCETLKSIPTSDMRRLFSKAAELGVGIELNSDDMKYIESESVLHLYRIAKECGCKFYFGSDAHHPDDLDRAIPRFEKAIDLLELCENNKFVLL